MPEPKSKRGGRVWGLYQQGVSDRGRAGEMRDIWEIEEDRRERRRAEARESELSELSERSEPSGGAVLRGRADGDGRTHRSAPTNGLLGEDVVLKPDVERVPHSPLDPRIEREKRLELARLSDTPSGVWLGRPWGSSTLDVLSGRGEDKGAKMSQTLAGGDFTFGGRDRGAGENGWSYRKSEEGGERDVFGAQMDRIARETERMGGKAFAEARARDDADRRANPISYGLRALSGRYGRDTIDAVAGSSDEEKTLYATNRVLGDYKNDRRLVERVVSGKDGWLSRMGKTFWDDMDGGMKLLDFGVEDAVTTRAITMAMAKFDKVGRDGLSQAERNLLDAVAVRDTYRAFYEEQLGDNWSGAGRVTAEALPFVRDMVLGGGLSGTARGAAGGAAKAGAKEAAKGAVKGAVRRYLGEWLKKAPGQIAGTLIIEMPRVASDTEERMHGRLVATSLDGWDSDNVGFGGRREGAEKSRGVAFAKALGNQSIEVVSETLGEPMMKGLGLAGRAVFKPLAKSGVGKAVGGAVSELGAKLGSRPTARAVGRFYTGAKRTLAPMREMTRVGGFAEEFLEEQVGGTANALLIGDQSMSDVWGLSGMEQTAVALLPMQVAFGGVGAVGSTARLGQVNGAVRRSAESLRVQGGDVDALQGRLRECSYVELEAELLSRHTKLEEVVSRLRDESLGVEERLSLEGEARRVGAEMRYVSNWMSREMLVGASEAEIEEARGKLESDLESRRRALLEEEWTNGKVLVHRDDAGDVVDYEIVEVTYGPNDAKGCLVSGAVRDGKVCLEDGSGGAVVVSGADGRRVQVHSDDVRVDRVLDREAVDLGFQAKVVADMDGRMQAVSGMMDAYEQGVLELSRDDVEGVVRDVMGRLGVNVPWRVMSREEVEAEGGKLDGSERGWYDEQSGEVVILSDGVSRKSVERTVLHEVVGHRGLAALFDRKALYDYFDSVWESMSDRDREEIADLYPGLSSSDLASEYIAHQAETYSNPGVWARIVSGFRQLLDGLGLSLKVSDGDIRMMLSRGVRAMQEEKQSGARVSDESEPSEPSAPSEPSEPSNPSAPSEPSEPSGDSGSGGASEFNDPTDPTDSTDPTDPSDPSGSSADTDTDRNNRFLPVGFHIHWRDEPSGKVRGGKIVGVVDSDLYMVLPDWSDSPVSVGRDLVMDDFGSIAPWGLSDEVDADGSPYVLSPNGSESFGVITEDMSRASGMPSGEVRLPLGEYDIVEGLGYGAEYLDHTQGDEIKAAGFNSVAEFVASVFGNVTEIRRAQVFSDGTGTYYVVSRDDRGRTDLVEIQSVGGYWSVIGGWLFNQANVDERELLWSAVPALGIDPATESQEDMTTQVGYPGSPASLSGNSTEKAPSLRESSVSEGGQDLTQTSEEAAAALSALPDSSQGETTRGEDGQPLIMPSESTDSPEEAGALSSGTSNSPTGEGGSVPVSRDGLPAKPGSSSTMTEDRNTNEYSSTTSPSKGKGSKSVGNKKARGSKAKESEVQAQQSERSEGAVSQRAEEEDMLAGDAVEVAERLLEMCDGDRDMARKVVSGVIDNLKASRRKAARKLSSKGLSAAEYMDRLKAQKGELAEIDAELQRLNDVIGFVGSVGYRSSEEGGPDAPGESESEGVSLEGVNPNADETVNSPAVQRALGYKILRGDATLKRIYRQKPEEVERAEGAATEVRFSSTVTCKGRYAVISRSQLQPSHVVSSTDRYDRTNPMHFIPEAQPKEDRQKASSVASAYAIARSIRPEEITGAVTAYVGAPNVNERGEVIQGNNRSIALKLLAGAEKEKYEAYLRAHLAEFGIDEAEFDAIEDPVLVNMLPVRDEEAIRLGQLTQSDTESATGRRVTSDVSKRMSEAQYKRFMSLLLGSVDDVESDISESVESGAKAALEYLYEEGVINTDEYSNSLREDGGVRSGVVRSFEDIVYGVLEEGATVAVRDALRRLPSDLRKSLVLVLVQDRMLPKEKRLVGDVQQAVLGMYELYDGKPFSGRLRDEAVARLGLLLGTPSLFDQSEGLVVPYKLFNAGAVELMKLLLRGDAALVRNSLMDYYSYARGAKNLFVDTPALDKEDAYRKVFPEYGELHRQLEERDGEGGASSSEGGVVSKGANDQGGNAYLSEADASGSETSDGKSSESKPVIDQNQDDGRREDGDDAREGGTDNEGSLPEQSRGNDVASGVSTLSNGGDTEGSSEGASGASDGVGTGGLLGSSEAEQGGDTPVGVPEPAASSDEGLHTEGHRGSSRSDSEAERGDDAVGGSEHESRFGHGGVGWSAGKEDSGAGDGSSATSDGRGSRSVEDNKRYSNAEIAELVSSVTDVVDGQVVLTGDVTDELRRAVSGYRSGGVAKSGRGVLDEYYTPRGVVSFVKRVLDGLPEIGDAKRPALILEPSVGVGNFLDGIPKLANRSALIRAYDVNEISARIAKVLHPEANVRIAPFESLFMDDRGGKRKPESMGEYDLVLGNPPYGDHRGKYRGLGEEPKIARYEDYFVKRSLDLLREGGVLAMVLPSGWLNRHKVERGWRIEVAYRLPNGVFAGTDVGTDVVVLRKDSKYKGEGSHNYFESHPDHVLGELGTRKNRYGREEEYVAWSDKSEVLQEAEAQKSEQSEGAVTSKSSKVSEQSDAQSGGEVATSDSEQSVSNESDVDRSYGSEWFKEKNGHYLGFLDYLHSQGKSDEEVRSVVEELDGFLAREGRLDDEPLVDYWVRRWRGGDVKGVLHDNVVPGEMSFSPRGTSGVYRVWEWNDGDRKVGHQVTKAEYDFVDYLTGLNDIAKSEERGDVTPESEVQARGSEVSEESEPSEPSDGAVTPESDGAEESGAGVSSGTSVSSDEGGIAKGETGDGSGTVEEKKKGESEVKEKSEEKGKSKRNGKALNTTQTALNTQAKSVEKDGESAAEEKGESKEKEESKEKGKGKSKRKGSGLPKIKRGQIKYDLSKGDEVINASDQFLKRFTEEEMSAFADCDLGGYLAHPEAHPSVACYVGDGRWMHRFYYCSGNIYARLENLELLYAMGQVQEDQYLGQKALLEAVLPSYKDLGHIYLTPNVEFVKSLILPVSDEMGAVGGVSLKDRFLEYVEELPYDAFGRSSKWEVRSYIENRPVRGGDKAENAAERRRRKDVGDRLFRDFLEHELTESEQQEVERKFNRAYNGTYTPDYTGVPMFSQINKNFHGKPLQLTSVQLAGVGRMSMRGVGVLAHEVGFGKTLSGVLSAHEAMTRGHAKRPLIVCPNDSILEQWVETIYEALPEAKINVLGNLGASYDLTDFSVGEGEITLVTYEGLKRMGFKDETYDRMAGEFTYIQEDLKTHQSSARDKAKKEAQVDRLVGRMMRGARQEYSFEDLGFDYMVFDEVHNANHIVGKVRLDKNVASDFRSQSQRTSDLGIKTWLAAQWIQSQNSGRNVVLLSATPFTNKPLEYYSVLSLVANDRLKELGFYRVEQFFETFMEAEPDLEIGADGSVTERMAVRRFKNNAVFNNLLREFVDVKGVEDNPNLVRPERHVKEYKVPQNDMTRDAMTALSVMLTDDKQKLAGIGHARLIAFSPFASGASGFTARNYKEFVEGSPKLLATMRLVAESKRGNDSSGQLIYSELGIEYFDLLREYLIREVGYKEDEVVILSGKTSISERGRIQKGFNDGHIKVVLGSPAIKEGVNLQRNATDLYILSLPWNFTQLIQVEGRCWRQGNQWHHLRVNYMLTEDSADVFMLQKLQTKQRLYEEAMRADADIVDVGDIDAEELKMDLIRDPKSRASFATAEKRKELQHERETLVAEQSVLSDALTTYNESQSRADSIETGLAANMGRYSSWEVSSQKSLIKKEREKAERAKARLERKVGAVERAEGRISDLTRDIADVDKRLEGLEQYYDDLVVSYAEQEQSRQANRSFDEVVGGFVEERKQENSGDFYTKFTDEELNKRVRYRREAAGEESELEAVNGRRYRRTNRMERLESVSGDSKLRVSSLPLNSSVEVVPIATVGLSYGDAMRAIVGLPDRIDEYDTPEGVGALRISKKTRRKLYNQIGNEPLAYRQAYMDLLPRLVDVVRSSVLLEEHGDRVKSPDGIRYAGNEGDENIDKVQRLYGAVRYGGISYRVKTTVRVYRDEDVGNRLHSYDISEIELLAPKPATSQGEMSQTLTNNSISLAKLIKGVELSYESGRLLSEAMLSIEGGDSSGVRYRRVEGGEESELEAVNDRFNSELDRLTEDNANGVRLSLGRPSGVLLGAGVADKALVLYGNKLIKKAHKHGFDVRDLRDLPRAVANPIGVFDTQGDGSRAILTELRLDDKQVLVAIRIGRGPDVEFNIVSSVYGKSSSRVVHWLAEGYAKYINKEKALNYISSLAPIASATYNQELSVATKVVKEFENPKESERESRSYQSDRSHQSDREAQSGSAEETASDVVERGVRERRYRRRREADRELMGRKLSPTERAFVGRMERLRERYGQSVSLDAGGTMWGLRGVMDNSLVQRRERVKTEWVDATNPIRVYEERVGALSGRPVEGSRSVWMRYNQTSSRATSKIEELEGGVYRELAKKLREVSRRLGLTGEQLDDYLFAKHAPERNAYMRQRGVEQRLAKLDAKHADDPLWLDSSERRKAEAKYKAKEAKLEYAYETQLGEDIPEHFTGHELLDGVEGVADLVEQFEEAMRSRGLSVEELWKAVRAVNDAILVVWRDCGMMSQEAYEAVSGMYEWYVPMQGFAEESRGDYEYMHDHVGGFVQPIQRAKGRVSRPDRPLLAMYRKIRSAVIGGYHNVEKQAFYGLVSNYPSDYTSLGRQYYSVGEDGLLTPLYPSSFASEDIEEFEDRMREGLADGTVTLIRERGARVAYLTDPRSLGEHVVKVMIGGREHLVFVNGRPDLAQAVNRINVGEDTDVERFAKGLLRGMAQNVTSRNPSFMVVNLLRDAQMSLAVNFLKRGGVYTRAYMRNYLRVSPLILGRIWGKGHTGVGVSREVDAYWDEFKRYGGQTGYARLLSEHKARRRVNSLLDAGGKGRAVRVGEDVLNIFARPNEMIESWGRFATYVTSREMGRSVTESISDAKEVSVNFNRKGAGRSGLYRLIGACQMFFNAGVQGMNLAYGVAVENPWGSSAVVASLMVLGYAVAALQDGDDDHGDVYRAINPAVRKSNMCFVVDKDSYIKVPLAIEMRAFYGIGQELYGLVSGKKDAVDAVLGSMDSMGEIVAYNPTNGASPLAGMVEGQRRGESVGSSLYRGGRGFVPAQIQPITDLLANQNFYGGALRWESRYVDKSLPLYKRLPKHTPEWQVSVSKWINGIGQDKYVSEWRHGVLSPLSDPLVYSYLCSQYFGGIVQMLDQVDRAVAADGVRGAVSASPVTNRFYRYDDSLRGRGIEERFWELRRDVESRSKVQRGMRESLEGARSMREYDARSRAIVEYGKGVDYEMLEGWFKDFDKLYKEYKSRRGMLTDEEDRAWRGELQQVEAEMYSEIKEYMLAVGG